jgi:hypothetical protein
MNALGAYLFEPVSASGLAKVAAGCVGALAQSQATAGLGITPRPGETAQELADRQDRDRWQVMAVGGIGLTALLLVGARFGAGWYVGKQFGRPGWGTVAGGFFGAPGMGLLALFPDEE